MPLYVVIRDNFTSLPTCNTLTCGIVVKQTLETQINENRQRKRWFCNDAGACPDTEVCCADQAAFELQENYFVRLKPVLKNRAVHYLSCNQSLSVVPKHSMAQNLKQLQTMQF